MKQLLILTLLLCCTGMLLGAELECNILQYKTGRFYFPNGIEDNVYQDCSFVLYNDDDSVLAGYIEDSYPGISYSYQYSVNIDTGTANTFQAIIKIASVDSTSSIKIGILKYQTIENFADIPDKLMTQSGNVLNIKKFNSFFEMKLAFENGDIDGFLAYQNYMSPDQQAISFSLPAMYYAAMIPNISKSINNRGVLTTSLYYRFNPDLFSIYYEGDGLQSFNSLYFKNETGTRWFDYNPSKGHELLKIFYEPDMKLDLYATNKSLSKLADFFGDLLSREKIKTTLDSGDVYFSFILIEYENPGVSLDYIHTILLNDVVMNDPSDKILDVIEGYIDLGMTSNNPEMIIKYFNKAEQSLIEDFGVFPLFRPTIYFTTADNIKGVNVNADGWLDLSELRRVNLPPRLIGANK